MQMMMPMFSSARHKDYVLIGDDTDLLVLLLHHAEMDVLRVGPIPEIRPNAILTTEQNMVHRAVVLSTHAIIGCKVTCRILVMGK